MHGGLELFSLEMSDLCPLSPLLFCVSLFLRILPLFSPFSISLRYCVPHIMNHMLFLWSVDCTLYTRNWKWSSEIYFDRDTTSFMLLFLEHVSPAPLLLNVTSTVFRVFQSLEMLFISLVFYYIFSHPPYIFVPLYVGEAKCAVSPQLMKCYGLTRCGLVPCSNHYRGQ